MKPTIIKTSTRYVFEIEQFSEGLPHGILNKTKMYKNVFIGHTGLIQGIPEKAVNVWNLDTNAGWGNKLTIMDVDTEEYWQSDLITTLYPNFKNGRK